VAPPDFVDGRSLDPLLTSDPPASWRSAFLVEHRRTPEEFAYVRAIPNYSAIRTSQYNYVEYGTGERELYDLDEELTNIYKSASDTLISDRPRVLRRSRLARAWGVARSNGMTSCRQLSTFQLI
jgi:hypothetical protein